MGAVVVADDGRVFTGCNVENAAYGAAICAEGNAISSAAAAGVRKIEAVIVACLDTGECYPCGNCRQLMREFQVGRIVVQDVQQRFEMHLGQDGEALLALGREAQPLGPHADLAGGFFAGNVENLAAGFGKFCQRLQHQG